MKQLREYQHRMITHLRRHRSALLSVGCGLGKTSAVLHYLQIIADLRDGVSALIVAPKLVAQSVWQQEAEEWGLSIAPCMNCVCGRPPEMRKVGIMGSDIVITSRDLLAIDTKAGYYQEREFDVVVFDELTSFKSMASSRTAAALAVKAKQRIGLTGTFITNSELDIYGQLAVLGMRPTDKGSFYAWRGRYFKDALAGKGVKFQKWQLRREYRQRDLYQDVEDNIYTLTSDDYLTVPAVTYVNKAVTLSDKDMAAYMSAETMLAATLEGGTVAIKESARFAKLQQVANGFIYSEQSDLFGNVTRGITRGEMSKLNAVIEWVDHLVEMGERVLLFYQFQEEHDYIREKMGERVLRDVTDGEAVLNSWNRGEVEVLLAHPQSAAYGLNIQYGGHIIVWASLPYDVELFIQGNARLHRSGQTKPVTVYSFYADDTVEVGKVYGLKRKEKSIDEFNNNTKK